jgi:hypothetical protein
MKRGITKEDRLSPGLYRVHWVSGGSSLAAIGINEDGTNWLAPINWVRTCSTSWDRVARVERIDHVLYGGAGGGSTNAVVPFGGQRGGDGWCTSPTIVASGGVGGAGELRPFKVVVHSYGEPTSEADAWYAAEVERMSERAPA